MTPFVKARIVLTIIAILGLAVGALVAWVAALLIEGRI